MTESRAMTYVSKSIGKKGFQLKKTFGLISVVPLYEDSVLLDVFKMVFIRIVLLGKKSTRMFFIY